MKSNNNNRSFSLSLSAEELLSEMEVEVRTEDMGPVAKDIVVLQEADMLKKKKRGESQFAITPLRQ